MTAQRKFIFSVSICLVIFITGCESIGSNASGFELTVRAEPSTGGSVLTSGMAEGDVEVFAIPNRGWQFGYWSGDIESFENPLEIDFNRDIELVANFALFNNEYTFDLTLSASGNSTGLEFGQIPGATDGFDSNIDEETPPAPPGNTVYAWFERDEKMLRKDFRNAFTDEITWNLKFRAEESETLDLDWTFSEESFSGTIYITDPGENFIVDMTEENSVSVDPENGDELLIIYSYEEEE